MTNAAIAVPTPDSPLLIGFLVDVSGSMTTAMRNQRGQSLNRLQAFQQSLGELAKKAQTISNAGQNEGAVQLFAYGFGFGNPLSALFGRSGPVVRDLLSGVSGSDALVSIEELADDWQRYKDHVGSLAVEMFGATPMMKGFEVAASRLHAEEQRRKYSGKMLFVLSDGDPTDGDASDIFGKAASLKRDGTFIISCYVTNEDITETRMLYREANQQWPSGAKLMFDCSSILPHESAFQAYLSEHNWTFEQNSKLFSQVNQSEVLEEFLSLLLSPLETQHQTTNPSAPANVGESVFISYSHMDRDWLDRVRVHLKPLEREGLLDLWDDSRIRVGDEWRREISDAINTAKVAVLLVSADFLASDFIAKNELPPLLDAARTQGVRIVPVLVRPSRFEYTEELSGFQSLNPPNAPLSSLPKHEQESMLVRLSTEIENTLG